MKTEHTVHLKRKEHTREMVCPPEAYQPSHSLETEEWFGMTETEKRNILRKMENFRSE